MSTENKITNLEHLQKLALRTRTEVAALDQKLGAVHLPTKVSELSNDSGYQTAEQVAESIKDKADKGTSLAAYGITDAYTKTELDGKISAVYKPGGSVAFADLPAADEAHLGMVYNITDKFTSTAGFVEGAGTKHPAGTNVAVVKVGEEFKYDALAGFVDLSGYQLKEEGKVLSSNDFTDEEKAKLGAVGYATDEEVDAMLAEVFGAGTENT